MQDEKMSLKNKAVCCTITTAIMFGVLFGVQSCEDWKIAKRLKKGTAQLEYVNSDKLKDIVIIDSYEKNYIFYGQEDGTYKGLDYITEDIMKELQQKQNDLFTEKHAEKRKVGMGYEEKLDRLNQQYKDELNKLK